MELPNSARRLYCERSSEMLRRVLELMVLPEDVRGAAEARVGGGLVHTAILRVMGVVGHRVAGRQKPAPDAGLEALFAPHVDALAEVRKGRVGATVVEVLARRAHDPNAVKQ